MRDARELIRPVLAVARHHACLSALDPTQHAIAIELHLMHPRIAGGRRLHQSCKFRFDDFRQRVLDRTLRVHAGSSARFGRFFTAPVLTFSSTDLFECHTRSGSLAISSRMRPLATLFGPLLDDVPSASGFACSSRSLIRNQAFSPPYFRLCRCAPASSRRGASRRRASNLSWPFL